MSSKYELTEDNLKDGEMREVSLTLEDDSSHPILLVREDGEVTALGAKCTHYNFNLAKGVLCKGIIRCPLHGACFNAKSGDIEDFPGLDSLPVYQISRENGKIFALIDDPEQLTSRRVKPMADKDDKEDVFVILGGGPAALSCAETLRQNGFTGRIVMVMKERRLPYDRVKLSKDPAVDPDSLELRPRSFFEDHGIELLLDAEALKVNFANQSVMTKRFTHIEYSKLLIATGASPRLIPIRGGEKAKNIRYLRTPDDANAIFNEAQGQDILIVGSGFIGMEVASALSFVATRVTIVTMDEVPFQLQLGERVGRFLRKWHESRGISFQCKTSVRKVNVEPVNGDVYEVVLNNARIIPACLLIVGVGIVPNTAFLCNIPSLEDRDQPELEKNSNGFVKVSPFMETSVPNVFAAGDAVEFNLRLPKQRTLAQNVSISHWQMALKMGRVAALNMFPPIAFGQIAGENDNDNENGSLGLSTPSPSPSALPSTNPSRVDANRNQAGDGGGGGGVDVKSDGDSENRKSNEQEEEEEDGESLFDPDSPKTRFVSVPVFWSVQYGQSLRFAGWNSGFDDVIIHGNPAVDPKAGNPDPVFAAFYLKGDRVVAAASLNRDPIVAQFAEALRTGVVVMRDHNAEDADGFVKLLNR